MALHFGTQGTEWWRAQSLAARIYFQVSLNVIFVVVWCIYQHS